MSRSRRAYAVAGACAAFVLSSAALADEPKVELMAEVVLASNQGSVIDPPELVKMKDLFMKEGFSFTSYRRLSSEKVGLQKGKPHAISLPNQRTATLRLQEIQQGTAKVSIDVAKLVSTTLTLGREGAVFQHVGNHESGKLVLVLSPAPGVRPRGPLRLRPTVPHGFVPRVPLGAPDW